MYLKFPRPNSKEFVTASQIELSNLTEKPINSFSNFLDMCSEKRKIKIKKHVKD